MRQLTGVRSPISSEQKIDGIAKSVNGIHDLLQRLNLAHYEVNPNRNSAHYLSRAASTTPLVDSASVDIHHLEHVWDHSPHIIDFVQGVVNDIDSRDTSPEANEILSSLRRILHALENPSPAQDSSRVQLENSKDQDKASMPPLEAVVAALRWAKEHQKYTRISAISYILPIQRLTDICQKVYFSVDGYSEADFILTNGYLHSIFTQRAIGSELQIYKTYSLLCRNNLEAALSHLPLLLPASLDMIAALTLGALASIENSKATQAWVFVSAAFDLSIRLGYHRLRLQSEDVHSLQQVRQRLFWTVYKIEKGLSLRFGRPSNIRESEITTPCDPDTAQRTSLARIQGMIYERIYSPSGLTQTDDERLQVVEELSTSLHELIRNTNARISNAINQTIDINTKVDPMQLVYLRCDLVCQLSCLALVLRAASNPESSRTEVTDACLSAARDALDMHQRCMVDVRACSGDPSQVTKYINCAIMHGPFVPFNILFTHTIQYLEVADLARLDSFATSLQCEVDSSLEAPTHPHRLYELLSKGARLYFDLNAPVAADMTLTHDMTGSWGDLDLSQAGAEVGFPVESRSSESDGHYGMVLSDWYDTNQQVMSLFEDASLF